MAQDDHGGTSGVVLSFLLIHYFYDHILFREFDPLMAAERTSAA
jgi:hypothetical protein